MQIPLSDEWKSKVNDNYELFGSLVALDHSLNLQYGIVASAILWTIRHELHNLELKKLLENEYSIKSEVLLEQLINGRHLKPLDFSKLIASQASSNEDFRDSLNILINHFQDSWITYKLLKRVNSYNIHGTIEGANIVIGGEQYVAGDLIIQYLRPKPERSCPKAPRYLGPFAGRDSIINEVVHKLTTESKDVVALYGFGGIGKTSIAKKIADKFSKDEIFCSVLWANITRNPEPIRILSDWVISYADASFDAASIKDKEQIAYTVKALLESVINERCENCQSTKVLIVLDDAWDNGKDTVKYILKSIPYNSVVLLTTRSLEVALELDIPQSDIVKVPPLFDDNAVQMLEAYLEKVNSHLLLQLGQALGGHALALTLAVRRIRKSENYVKAIESHISLYKSGILKGEDFNKLNFEQGSDKDDNLTIALSYSYDELSPSAKSLFRKLGVIAPNAVFDQALLSFLWDIPFEEVQEYCDILRLLSLIEIEEEGKYIQHSLLRSYALVLLGNAGEFVATFKNYLSFLTSITEKFNQLPNEQWGVLEDYFPHLTYTGDRLVELTKDSTIQDPDLIRIASKFLSNSIIYLRAYPELIFDFKDGEQLLYRDKWIQCGIEIWHRIDQPEDEASGLLALAHIYNNFGKADKALDFLRAALNKAQSISNKSLEANILLEMGGLSFNTGDRKAAKRLFEQAAKLFRNLGFYGLEAIVLSNIASTIYYALGDYDKGIELNAKALAVFIEKEWKNEIVNTFVNIAGGYAKLEDYEAALSYYLHALEVTSDKATRTAIFSNLGALYSSLGKYDNAEEALQTAIQLARLIGYKNSEATILKSFAQLYYFGKGNADKALEYLYQGLEIVRSSKNVKAEASFLNEIGTFLCDIATKTKNLHKQVQAIEILQSALVINEQLEDLDGQSTCLHNLGRIYWRLGVNELALSHYQKALDISKMLGREIDQAITLKNMSSLFISQNQDLVKAIELLDIAATTLRNKGRAGLQASILLDKVIVLTLIGKEKEARKTLTKAIHLLKDNKLSYDDAGISVAMYNTLLNAKNLQQAIYEISKEVTQAGLASYL